MSDTLRRIGRLGQPIWLYLVIAAIALAFGWPLCRRAIILSDEGYMLQQALDLLGGLVIYRDMDAFITPGMWFAIAGVFALVGPSVIASRVLILVAFLALALTGYRIVAPTAGRGWGLAAVGALLLFSVWAFPAWTFAFYSPVAVLFALLALERLLAWGREGRPRDLALVGIFLGLSICFKQNYGVFGGLALALGYLAMKFEGGEPARKALAGAPRELALLAGGAFLAGLPFLLYLLAHDAMGPAWASLVVHPFEFGGRHGIPYASFSELWNPDLFPTGADKLTYLSSAGVNLSPVPIPHVHGMVQRLHVLLYWLAPLIIASGLALSRASGRARGKRIDAPLFTVSAAAGAIFLGVFPRADFNHLVNVYQPVLIAGPLIIQRLLALLGPHRPRARAGLWAAVAIIASPYAATALYWYAGLLERLDAPLSAARGGVWVSPLEARDIDYQVRMIRENTAPGEALLTLPDLTMLNFLAERPVPSAWYNLYEHHIAGDRGRGVVLASEAKQVGYAVARFNNFFSDRVGILEYAPELTHYLVTHFERSFVGARENYMVYERRDEPSVEHSHQSALASCESETELGEIRDHLLFSALYHRSLPGRPIPEEGTFTLCRVRVPDDGGVLGLEIGYRRPRRSTPGTNLEASIAVIDQGRRKKVLDEQLQVVRWRDSPRQRPFERIEIELAPWAGKEITLEFRTRLIGSIRTSGLDLKGFAMIYRDPRVQSRPGGARP
ncbi:MAG: hypothetical protein NZ990_18085 [Myxococcota bacterium]|nr:hypothetical protein [Myxococcota bacterium]